MIKVSAAEFQRNFGRYSDMALVEPIAVTRNGRDRTVTMSIEEYRKMRQGYRRVLRLEDITDEMLEAIEKAEPSPEAEAFNHEYKS